MLKKIFWSSLIIGTLFACVWLNASAATEYTTSDGWYTYEIYENEAKLVDCDVPSDYSHLFNETTPLIISSVMYNDKLYPVTAVGEYCFAAGFVYYIYLGDSVKTLEEGSMGTAGYIKFGKGVENVHPSAFDSSVSKFEVVSDNPYFSAVDGVLYNKTKTTLVKYAGSYYSNNSEFTIPSTVKKINAYAFDGREHFQKINVPESVNEIGEYAFSGCKKLTDIKIPEGVKRIENWSFKGVPFSGEAILPSTLTYIGDYSFAYGGNDKCDLVIPNCVTTIGRYAFEQSKFKSITLSENLASLDYGSFYNCNITEIVIPGSLKVIYDAAFRYCGKLEKVTILDGVEKISTSAFRNCTALKDITIAQTVTQIERYAFYGCTALENIVIPNRVCPINEDVFYNCTSLKTITLPERIGSIGSSAFYGCTALTDIYYNGSERSWNEIVISGYNTPLANATMHFKLDIVFNIENEKTNMSAFTGSSITLPNVTQHKPGYEFAGWEYKDGTVYQAGDVISDMTDNMTFTAKFNRTIYTETEYKYGGYQIKPTGIPAGSYIIVASTTANDNKFIGSQVYDGGNSITIFGSNATNYKVFVWSGIDNLKPLCEPEIH